MNLTAQQLPDLHNPPAHQIHHHQTRIDPELFGKEFIQR